MHVYVDFILGAKIQLKINKNIDEIYVIQYYGDHKELFNFNKFAKLIYLIILERCYFIMKLLWRN